MPEETQNSGATPDTGAMPVSFDSWLKEQPDDVKAIIGDRFKNLETTLTSERDARKGFEKQVRDLATKAELGSEAQKQLTTMAEQIQAAERRQSFYDEAHTQGISNLKLAYLAATDSGFIDDRGRVNWEQLKKAYPQLVMAVTPPRGNAGDGAGTPPGKSTMNTIIRRAAGYNE